MIYFQQYMSQTLESSDQKTTWVLVSSLKENVSEDDLVQITPKVEELIDQWHSAGKIMWSGPFNDNKTGMAVFEATEREARDFYEKYDKACSRVLAHYLYQWDAMPILSLFSKK